MQARLEGPGPGVDDGPDGRPPPPGTQVEELRRLECQRGQGVHFARPMDPEAFAALLVPRRRSEATAARVPLC